MAVLQLIDEDKKFNPRVNEYFTELGISRNGVKYHVVSVFGSQSTGKSTLLNALFGTDFGVMNEKSRGQTTKGIWMGKSGDAELPSLILDVEGTDGRERGEDQDFERKAALFALATSEVLIVNMWENQVGLYQGANMGLLKTVFEVNLSLFLTGGRQTSRSCIMFVIRDYMGLTPLENLAQTLTEDLNKHWASIAKPTPELESSKIQDFFDIQFTVLPHKLLQGEQFSSDVAKLRSKFSSGDLFKPEYHRNVPIDGWPMYAEQIWQQIELNKDLDLPTQQTLVARFRCEEISAEAFREFTTSLDGLGLDFSGKTIIPQFGAKLGVLRKQSLDHYDSLASRYEKKVYNEKRFELLGKVDGILTGHYQAQLAALHKDTLQVFRKLLQTTEGTFKHRSDVAYSQAVDHFTRGAKDGVIDPSFYSYSVENTEMIEALATEVTKQRQAELKRITAKLVKKACKNLDQIHLHFSSKATDPWQAVVDALNYSVESVLSEYVENGFGLGESSQEALKVTADVDAATWKGLEARIRELVRPDNVVQQLRDRFEESFRYTPEGLPVVWTENDDVEGSAIRSRKVALDMLPKFAAARYEDGTVVQPSLLPSNDGEDSKDEDDEDDRLDYSELLTPTQLEEIERRFKRSADAAFVEAKRAATQSSTHIPFWIYGVIVVLGWNEFMAILRNPLLILLLLILAGAGYTVWSLNLAGPLLSVADATFERITSEAKSRLRDYLVEDGAHGPVKHKPVEASVPSSRQTSVPPSLQSSFKAAAPGTPSSSVSSAPSELIDLQDALATSSNIELR